jgi:hypothetical protein
MSQPISAVFASIFTAFVFAPAALAQTPTQQSAWVSEQA